MDYVIIKDEINSLRDKCTIDERKNIINDKVLKYESPIKEFLEIYTLFGKYYSVPKVFRIQIYDNYLKIIENVSILDEDKFIINVLLLDALYKDYRYNEAEEVFKKICDSKYNNKYSYLNIAEYLVITRRYDLANKYFDMLKDDDNSEFKELINNKLIDLEKRKNGKHYLPLDRENKIKYQEFMKSLDVLVTLPIERAKAPQKIKIDDYPILFEKVLPGFNSFVAFDLETTGVDPTKDSITEMAAIKVVNGKVVETKKFIFQELVHPYKKRIPKEVEDITGITNEMVYNCREVWEVFNDFMDFVGDDILLGYNCINFDMKFLVRAGRLSNRIISNRIFDVFPYAKNFKLNQRDNKLTTIGLALGIENPQAHRALADSITTAKVYLKLLELDTCK